MISKSRALRMQAAEQAAAKVREENPLIDIGVNITNKQFQRDWMEVVERAQSAGVSTIFLYRDIYCRQSQELGIGCSMAQRWATLLSEARGYCRHPSSLCYHF